MTPMSESNIRAKKAQLEARRAKAERDGFEIVEFKTGEVVRFVACNASGRQRETVEMGLLRNMNTEAYGVRDTREGGEEQ